MTFSVVMLALTVWAFEVALDLNTLEDAGFFGSELFVLGVMISMCAFAVLTLAHAICVVLRLTVWSNARA